LRTPVPWARQRCHCRRLAALDGLFMHLYGLGDDDAAYVLDAFPIVREQDLAAFGRHRTKEDVLAQLGAISAGTLRVTAGGEDDGNAMFRCA
jgi:hypothetical protein